MDYIHYRNLENKEEGPLRDLPEHLPIVLDKDHGSKGDLEDYQQSIHIPNQQGERHGSRNAHSRTAKCNQLVGTATNLSLPVSSHSGQTLLQLLGLIGCQCR